MYKRQNDDSAKANENEKEYENDLIKISAKRTVAAKDPRKAILEITDNNNIRVSFFYCLLFLLFIPCIINMHFLILLFSVRDNNRHIGHIMIELFVTYHHAKLWLHRIINTQTKDFPFSEKHVYPAKKMPRH